MVETIQIELTISIGGHTIQHMGDAAENRREFFYEVDPGYRVHAANTILTTMTGGGQIKIDFCLESLVIPNRITQEILANGEIGQILDVDPPEKFMRRVQTGVLLTLKEAEATANFILMEIERAKTIEK